MSPENATESRMKPDDYYTEVMEAADASYDLIDHDEVPTTAEWATRTMIQVPLLARRVIHCT